MQWMCEAALYTKNEKAFFDVTQGPHHVLFSSHPATQQEQQDCEFESQQNRERERDRQKDIGTSTPLFTLHFEEWTKPVITNQQNKVPVSGVLLVI